MVQALDNLYETFADVSPLKWIRLVAIVGGYIFFRNIVEKELQKRKIKKQIQEDEQKKLLERENTLVENPDQIEEEESSTGFGWGNKTRKRVEKQRQQFEEAAERLRNNPNLDDSDDDIKDLLIN